MINSPITDFLIRIKNGYKASRKTVTSPASKFNTSLIEVLKKHGFVTDYQITDKVMTITLSYNRSEPKVTDITLFSTPGHRLYQSATTIPWGKTNHSLIIVSTSKGLMSQKEAVKAHLGGEIIAEVY